MPGKSVLSIRQSVRSVLYSVAFVLPVTWEDWAENSSLGEKNT